MTAPPVHQGPCGVLPFDPAAVAGSDVDIAASTYAMVSSSDKSYRLVLAYVANHLCHVEGHRSVDYNAGKKVSSTNYLNENDDEDAYNVLLAGIGLHKFSWKHHTLHCLRQEEGDPVGTNCDAVQKESLLLFAPKVGSEMILKTFIDELVAAAEATKKGYICISRWSTGGEYWDEGKKFKERPLASVVLPHHIKTDLLADIDDFVNDDSKAFYATHGIPYKRSYLFYGVPGAGKTSLIQALAGHYGRNVYNLQPTHPHMTDDSLQTAMEQLPKKSIVVLEDIDALFTKSRRKKVANSSLTFSGLLNALDGVGGHDGHIVILTTNFRDQLDDALIRNGRVDVHVPFCDTTPDQMADMFVTYYPHEPCERGNDFARALEAALGPNRKLCTAALQHYFVTQRRSTADGTIANVGRVAHEMDRRNNMQRLVGENK
ncbi:hypothetical protein DYB32_002827 [Aphanomyces invadans]|uniref:AAA+ ATPase domain-containing protein n=1 Tax=Aphanomyces invadans TaxID=157072 RepID=A0A418B2Q9_9STRA|nr:hypothetical protein DYB32_002827 [Aphanomyces invadans]